MPDFHCQCRTYLTYNINYNFVYMGRAYLLFKEREGNLMGVPSIISMGFHLILELCQLKKTQAVVLIVWHTINSISDFLMNSTKSSFTNSLLELQLACVIKPLKTSYPNYNLRVLPTVTSTIFLHFQLALVIKIQYLSPIIVFVHTKYSSKTI